MSLFKKGESKIKKENEIPELPELKEEEGLPELPELKEKPELPKFGLESHEKKHEEPNFLPSFPKSKTGDAIGQEIVKHAINEPEDLGGLEYKREILGPYEKRTIELDDWRKEEPVKKKSSIRQTGPLFVKIDKFKKAVEHFENIKEKIKDIENLLNKVREVKIKEEGELVEWERELQVIKSRIESIDQSIFSKVE